MKKLLMVVAMAGGLMFAGLSSSADADHRGNSRYRGSYHGRYNNNWNRGYHNHRYNYRYNDRYNYPRSGVNFRLNVGSGYGGYYSPGFYGPSYGNFNYCW